MIEGYPNVVYALTSRPLSGAVKALVVALILSNTIGTFRTTPAESIGWLRDTKAKSRFVGNAKNVAITNAAIQDEKFSSFHGFAINFLRNIASDCPFFSDIEFTTTSKNPVINKCPAFIV